MNEINSSRIKLSQLRALVTVAEYGNFSEAALHLELSQSAISHAIATLEEELGVILLYRGRHGAHLTPVGERVIDHARSVLQLLGAIEKEVNLEKGLHGGSVRIACFRSVATHILPAAIARFRDRYPKIAVSIIEHSDYLGAEQALRDGHADIGFTALPGGDEFEGWEILRDEYIVVLPPTPKLETDKITWEQLATYPLILAYGNACYALLRQHLVNLNFHINPAYEVKQDSTTVGMVLQGLGAAILPRLAAEPLPPEVQVYSLPVPLERVIRVAVLANSLQSPAVFAFLDTLRGVDQCTLKAVV
ncbi:MULTISPECIES: LysR family transcriptional regulator [Cyanophyceae]|uniref:LysR family transcriptional regulator n=1 Tax=Cyanophyceae TaxID=3028117 RepID=UPI00168779C1|nr:LysR family transcriptional regulator [Trichocoleus sp. FACHB-40]MBD2006271.1 LysR family transcriptional regulator [Trichocoleus sp. FACHB-40]